METGEVLDPAESWLVAQYQEWPEVREELEALLAEEAAERELLDSHLRQAKAEKELKTQFKRETADKKRLEAGAKKARSQGLRMARTAVLCLVYVAKADGRMDEDERATIAAFVRRIETEQGVALGWANVHARIKSTTCDREEFLLSMKQLRAGPANLRQVVLETAAALMMQDGVAHEDEHRAVSWLRVMLTRSS